MIRATAVLVVLLMYQLMIFVLFFFTEIGVYKLHVLKDCVCCLLLLGTNFAAFEADLC